MSHILILTSHAKSDLIRIRNYSATHYSIRQTKAYLVLLRQAFKDIKADPFLLSSKNRDEIAPGIRSYHMSMSKGRVAEIIKNPRHVILYMLDKPNKIIILRILHDSSDIKRHINL